MTTRTHDPIELSTKRRDADERQYAVYYAVGFILFLPYVVMTRLLPRSAQARMLSSVSSVRHSVLDQTRAEVRNVLAFVFMA